MGIEQEMAAYHMNQAPADLGRAAVLGGALGVGGGVLSGLVGDLQSRLARKKKGPGVMAPPVIDVGVPVLKAADLGSAVGDTWTNFWERAKADPLYSTKMIGAFGAPLAAGYMGTKWLNKKKNQVLQQDALSAAKQDYHAALQDFAGQKVAGEKSALDKLAEERTAPAVPTPANKSKKPNTPSRTVGDTAAGPAVESLFLDMDPIEGYRQWAFHRLLTKKVAGEQKTALLGGFLGSSSPGEAVNAGANLYLPALLGVGGLGAVLGYNRAKKNDRSKETMDAIRDWDRKQFYAAPPVVRAAPAV